MNGIYKLSILDNINNRIIVTQYNENIHNTVEEFINEANETAKFDPPIEINNINYMCTMELNIDII